MGLDAMILVFWMLSFKQLFHSPFSPSSRGSLVPLCFLPSGWCHLPIWGYWYFSWQSWFRHELHPAFCMMYCTYKFRSRGFPGVSAGKESTCDVGDPGSIPLLGTPVFWPGEFHGLYSLWGWKKSDTTERLSLALTSTKQGDNIQPWRTPFPILNQSVVPCWVLTAASWPAYRFLRRQVGWSGIPISLRIFHSLLYGILGTKMIKNIYK